jgi:hypothetical protein
MRTITPSHVFRQVIFAKARISPDRCVSTNQNSFFEGNSPAHTKSGIACYSDSGLLIKGCSSRLLDVSSIMIPKEEEGLSQKNDHQKQSDIADHLVGANTFEFRSESGAVPTRDRSQSWTCPCDSPPFPTQSGMRTKLCPREIR